jgi:hypothetical protein
VFFFAVSDGTGGQGRQLNSVRIPTGRSISIDAAILASEGRDAKSLEIPVSPDWTARVYLQHDHEYLYFAFENVARGTSGSSRRFSLILGIKDQR